MPVIALASPKGGVGKTTAAVLLGTELAGKGGAVTMIDADPRQRIQKWASKAGTPKTLEVRSDISESNIIDEIERAAAEAQFVIVDLEGSASMMVSYAISRADLVLIPAQASQMDAEEAIDAIRLVQRQEKAFRRKIPYAILLTKTSAAIRSRTLRHILAEMEAAQIPRLNVELFERDAFKALFSFGGTLADLDPKQVSGIPDAIANARAFVADVIDRLRSQATKEERVA